MDRNRALLGLELAAVAIAICTSYLGSTGPTGDR